MYEEYTLKGMRICILFGTRPEIIKLSPLIRAISADERFEQKLIHSGQHYDLELSGQFIKELELPEPDYNLEVGSGTHAEQLSKSIVKIENLLQEYKPDVFIVHGDTNTTLAGALAAIKIKIPVGHVEAGLRSFDKTMPEEVNRILVDQCSELLFAQSQTSKDNLVKEGVPEEKIYLTGNTIVEACTQNLELAKKNSKILEEFKEDDYAVMTLHRAENTDNKDRLKTILGGLGKIKGTIVYPMHPRTEKKLEEYNLDLPSNIKTTKPLGYFDFLLLLSKAKLALTDSGGIQEESVVLKVPCLTLRDNTERPETVDLGANILTGADSERIAEYANKILENEEFAGKMRQAKNPYGDGKASERIIKAVVDRYEKGTLKVQTSYQVK